MSGGRDRVWVGCFFGNHRLQADKQRANTRHRRATLNGHRGITLQSPCIQSGQSSVRHFSRHGRKGKKKGGQWIPLGQDWGVGDCRERNGYAHYQSRALMPGLVAVAKSPSSTLLAMPGRQAGHVQLVSLPPCTPMASTSTGSQQPQFRSPIILAHNHPLSTLACTANGSHVLTTSERGTLLRVWDTSRGRLERELRRGVDRADMWGVKFEDEVMEGDKARKGGMVVGWSDKGTIHVWEGEKAGESSKP